MEDGKRRRRKSRVVLFDVVRKRRVGGRGRMEDTRNPTPTLVCGGTGTLPVLLPATATKVLLPSA